MPYLSADRRGAPRRRTAPSRADVTADDDPPDSRPRPDPTAVLAAALEGRFTVRADLDRQEVVSYLDTADRRLLRAGLDVQLDRRSRVLRVRSGDGAVAEQPTTAVRWPAQISALPPGPVRDRLTEPVGVRALVPFAVVRLTTAGFAVRNADDKIVARVRWSRGHLDGDPPTELPDRIEVDRLRGYDREADQIESRLADLGDSPLADPWLELVQAQRVPGEPPPSPAPMTADEPGDGAVARALLGYLDELEAALPGTIADLDTEYLHDLRVAVRRTRSVLKLLGDVLPDEMGPRYATQFRWLGDVTTPTRDLDVYLLQLPEMSRAVTRPTDLAGFAEHVAARRDAAFRTLRRALRSSRCTRMRAAWRSDLEAAIASPSSAAPTARGLADQRLHRTYRRVARRARLITQDSTSDQIHDLRKACKALRYLLEVFRPLCDPAAYRTVIADFKDLQNVLGAFQDGEVQAAALHEFAQDMLDSGAARADTLLAMGELAGHFDHRQQAARSRLTADHLTHLGKRVAAHVDRLITPEGERL